MKRSVVFFILLAIIAFGSAAHAAHCDFNADGFDDLATGVGGDDSGIQVLYGRAGGLSATNNQLLNLGADFGSAFACGDFNGDSVDDLAVGAQYANVGGNVDAGTVTILFGDPTWRLSTTRKQSLNEATVGGAIVELDQFGAAVAAGDFNGDGYSDLAIGTPGKVFSQKVGGAVYIVYGSGAGLTAAGGMMLTEDSPGMADTIEANDLFGYALAAGNFGKDTTSGCYDDLAIGVPGETLNGLGYAGAIHVVFGSSTGITTAESEYWTEDSSGVPGSSGGNDQFGSKLASGNFGRATSICGGTIADLAVRSGKNVGTISHAGAVFVFYGTDNGFSGSAIQMWTENSPGVADSAEFQDFFGAALAAGHNSNGDFLVIGTPEEALGTHPQAGVVHLLYTDPATHLLTAIGSKYYNENTSGIKDTVENYDFFGFAVATGDYNADGEDDVAIGSPGEYFNGLASVGAAHILYSGDTAFTQFFHQNGADMKGVEVAGDSFGYAFP